MNNPYDPRTGMTRGYSTPFFMDALRYQTQVPASIGQRKVNHFFGNYSSSLKDLNTEPTQNQQLWINAVNNNPFYNDWRFGFNAKIIDPSLTQKPSEDFKSNMPIYDTSPKYDEFRHDAWEAITKKNLRQPSKSSYLKPNLEDDAEYQNARKKTAVRKQKDTEL
jgi:hypothetical protein